MTYRTLYYKRTTVVVIGLTEHKFFVALLYCNVLLNRTCLYILELWSMEQIHYLSPCLKHQLIYTHFHRNADRSHRAWNLL